MSKKNVSKKNLRLSNLAIGVVVIAIAIILFNSGIVKTILTVGVALAVLYFIWKKLEKVQK